LADRSNGRAYAIGLCLSVLSPSSVLYMYCGPNGASYAAKVDNLKEVAYEESIGTKMNDFDPF